MAGQNIPELSLAVFIIRIVSPALVFLATLSLVFSRAPLPTSPSPITSVVVITRVPRRALILSLLSLASLTFLLDGLTFVVYAVLNKVWPQNTGIEINAILGIVAFSGLAALGTWKDLHGVPVWSLRRVKTAIAFALLLDIAHVVLLGLTTTFNKGSGSHSLPLTIPAILHLVFPAFRVLLLVPLLFGLVLPRVVYTPINTEDDTSPYDPTDSTFLLPAGGAPPSTGLSSVPGLSNEASKYGTFQSAHPAIPPSGPVTRAHTPVPSNGHNKPGEKPDLALDPSWRELFRRLRRITPYLWPSKSISLQFLAFLCILLLIIGRFVNFLLPWTLGELVHMFERPSDRSPWPLLFAYVGLRFLQNSGGLTALRDSLWAPVMQYSDREMSQLSFDHLLNLSFAFHMRRKTGELLRILDRGAAINHTLELILFNIIPTFFDIIIALVVFAIRFEWALMVVILCVMLAYVSVSVIMTQWRTQVRRRMNDRDVITRGIHTDCLLNYETVKYFGGEQHEGERYGNAIRDYQVLEYKVMISLNMLNLAQNFIITLGLLVGSMIVALRVTKGESDPSDFVFFITYLAQLYGPLNNLGYIYRSVNQSLVDTERLLKLLNEPTEVEDTADAPDLIVEDGEIEFDNVSFSYDNRTTALNGVSFKVPKGSSVALVGESGAGKSTILRLLYRFYDLKEGEGRILIDGQNIRDVTQKSLRKAIGVVPQDSVLFNTSISYNIGYGKFDASPDEIEAAAQGAQMHDRIMSFPDGYETKVGERGVRLSGGEKQRVAIARTLLKNPPILLLDEATSALDTSTEKDIQKALQNLQRGRSSLSIAHRLSTIASADVILVLKDGQIIEQGTHKELLAHGGVFATMWADQISTSGDPVTSIEDQSVKNEAVSDLGDQTESAADAAVEDEAPREPAMSDALVDTPEVVPAALDSTENAQDAPPVPLKEPEVFPADESSPPSQLAFPTSDDTQRPSSERISSQSGGGVTFGDTVNAPPSRTASPDPEVEPKRKRIASQNFQRFARKMSLTTRRQGSGTKREASSTPQDGAGASSVRNSNVSPAGSVQSDIDKSKDKKKDKKEKRKSIF